MWLGSGSGLPQGGTVRWIGKLPEMGADWTVGIELVGRFDEECLGFLDQRKRAKMQWVQDPSQSNVYNLNSVRCEVSRNFRNKKKAYLRAKIEEL